jgi:hypothetical protein
MKTYDTDTPTPRRQQEQNVQAWMRAAAYAAGTDPEEALFTATGNDEIHLAPAAASEDRDDLALGAALVCMGLIGWREREDLRSAQGENDVAGRLR